MCLLLFGIISSLIYPHGNHSLFFVIQSIFKPKTFSVPMQLVRYQSRVISSTVFTFLNPSTRHLTSYNSIANCIVTFTTVHICYQDKVLVSKSRDISHRPSPSLWAAVTHVIVIKMLRILLIRRLPVDNNFRNLFSLSVD